MRLLRVDYAERSTSLDLHPLVTVVTGLTDAQRTELFGYVRSIAAGKTRGLRGLAHHRDELVELDGHGDPVNLPATAVNPIVGAQRGSDAQTEGYRRAKISSARVEELRARLSPEAEAEVLELRSMLRLAIDDADAALFDTDTDAAGRGVAAVEPELGAWIDVGLYNRVGEAFVGVQQTPRLVWNHSPETAEQHQLDILVDAGGAHAPSETGHSVVNPEWAGAVTDLCRMLDQEGLQPLPDRFEPGGAPVDVDQTFDQVLDWTRQWLTTQEQLIADRDVASHAQGSTGHPIVDSGDQTGAATRHCDELRFALADAERRLAEHRRAIDELSTAEARYRADALNAAVVDGGRDADADADAQTGTDLIAVADRLEDTVGELDPSDGSLPLVVDFDADLDADESVVEFLERCRALSPLAQIIVLTGDPEAHEWAENLGPEMAYSVGRSDFAVSTH